MAYRRIAIPNYDLNAPSGRCFQLSGVGEARNEANEVYYRLRREPVLANSFEVVGTGLVNGFGRMLTARSLEGTVRTLMFPHDASITRNVYEYDTTQTPARFYAFGRAYEPNSAFVFNGLVHFLDSNKQVYEATGTIASVPLSTNSNLAARLSALGITGQVRAVAVWQNRVWIAIGNHLLWCDTGNVAEWRPEYEDNGATVNTNAGYQQFDEVGTIDGLAVDGDHFYVFGSGEVWSSQVLDVDVQFGFTPLSLDVDFIGGAISTRAGLFFFAVDGIYRFNGDTLEKMSEAVDRNLIGLETAREITAVIVHDDIYWCVEGADYLVVYNLIHSTINVVNNLSNIVFVGLIAGDTVSIGELQGEIGSLEGTIGNLSPEQGTIPVAYQGVNNTTGRICFFGFPDESFLRFNLDRNAGGRRTIINKISIPEMTEYAVRVKDKTSLNWGAELTPNRWGDVVLKKPFVSPDIEVIFKQNVPLTRIEVDFEIGAM